MANKHSVTDNGDLRKYYAAIPNIVFRLGLNPYELALYAHLKQIAGEGGTCWKSTATLAKETAMGAGTISRTKIALAMPRTELGGKALITIATEMQNGGKENHSISITDVWPENMSELERLRVGKASRSSVEGAPSSGERTRSSVEPNNNPLIKTHEEDKKRGFLEILKTDPLYSHIDFDFQIGLMQRWLARPEHKGRRLTERFVVNWLNKIDRPVDIPASGNGVTDRAEREAEMRRKMGWDRLSA